MATLPRVLLTGASGFLGRYLQAALVEAGATVVAAGRPGLDLLDPRTLDGALARAGTPLLLHAAAMAVQADCERDPARAEQANVQASVALCAQAQRWLFVSTDLVFGGDRAPYDEPAPTAPLSVYGRSKVAAERALLARGKFAFGRVLSTVSISIQELSCLFSNPSYWLHWFLWLPVARQPQNRRARHPSMLLPATSAR